MPMKHGSSPRPAAAATAPAAPAAPAAAPAERPVYVSPPALELGLVTSAAKSDEYSVVASGVVLAPMPGGSPVPAVTAFSTLKDRSGATNTVAMYIGREPTNSKLLMTVAVGSEWLGGRALKDDYAQPLREMTGLHAPALADCDRGMQASFGIAPAGDAGSRGAASVTGPDPLRHFAHLVSEADPAIQPILDATKATNVRELIRAMVAIEQHNQQALTGESGKTVQTLISPERERELGLTLKPKRARLSGEELQEAQMREAETELRKKGRLYDQILDLTSAFKGVPTPVLLAGPGGWGKTHAAQEIGTNKALFKHYVPIEILPGTEPRDLIGGIYPALDEKSREKFFVSIHGRLAEAAKRAQDGRTAIVLNEVGNLDSRTWNMMKTTLDPQNGMYSLQSEKPYQVDGAAWGLERIDFPVKNAVFIMTANIGEGYDSVMGDPAVRSRTVTLTCGPTRQDAIDSLRGGDSTAKQIITEGREYLLGATAATCVQRKFSQAPVAKVGRLYDAAVKFVADESLAQIPSPRNICRAIQAAEHEGDIGKMLLYQAEKWALLRPDNYPVRDQVITAQRVVKEAFA